MMANRRLTLCAGLVVFIFLSLLWLNSSPISSVPAPEPEPQTELEPEPPHYTSYSEIDFTLPPNTLSPDLFNLSLHDKPQWLTLQPTRSKPFVLRIAIITHPSDFVKRQAIREHILSNVPTSAVQFQHRFIMGYSPPASQHEDFLVLEEMHMYRDILRFDMIEDPRRMGEKRWRMLRWAAEAHRSTYDYFLSLDTDAFVRLHALALRMHAMHPEFRPRDESILWSQTNDHKVHFVANPVDDDSTVLVEDSKVFSPTEFRGTEWYTYPVGFAFLMSSHLVSRLTSPEIKLAHHVHFPSDDVVIGMWISEWAGDTRIVSDRPGFHDPPGHNRHPEDEDPIDWGTVAIHHVQPWEFRELRKVKEWEGEWEEEV
jgi:hypothetical protein